MQDQDNLTNHSRAPILLIAFNRPDNTKKVFEKIREVQPDRLYVSVDGPRENKENDEDKVKNVRDIVENVDWKCDVQYRFFENNFGSVMHGSSAITWAFENEKRLIILEDDCVPSLPFFEYSDYLLDKYKHDTRIWMISGRSHQAGSKYFNDQDYVFTHYGHTWGWATWKRCWQHFDLHMTDFLDFLEKGGAKNVLSTNKEGSFFNKLFQKRMSDKKFNWDFSFRFTILKNGGLCIVPAKNLIENTGYVGTHSNSKNKFHELKASSDYEISKEPRFIMISREYEKLHFDKHIKKIHGNRLLYRRIMRKIKRVVKKIFKK